MADLLGGYEILEHLGTGGQGDVFKVRDASSGRILALKQMWLGRDAERANAIRQQWQREARLIQTTSNHGIAKLVSFQDNPTATVRDPLGSLLIAYEFVPGSTLFSNLTERAPSLTEVSAFSARICDTVSQLHHDGIYHRDINPKNVLLRDNAFESPVLIDFGNVKLKGGTTHTRTGHYVATPGYAPPELSWKLAKLREQKPDWAKCDQWSLARTLLDCAAVAVGHDAHEIIHLRSDELLGDLHQELSSLAESLRPALEKDPADRYETVGALGKAINDALAADDSPIVLTAQLVDAIRVQLMRYLSFDVDAKMFSTRECFFARSGASFRTRTQFVIWVDNQSRLRAAFVARNESAVGTIRKIAAEIDGWLTSAGNSIAVVLFDRLKSGSEPHGHLNQVLTDKPSTPAQRPNARFILHTLSQKTMGVYFALSEPVRPSDVRLLAKGHLGRFGRLINLWRAAATTES